jgi:hypothetical protein
MMIFLYNIFMMMSNLEISSYEQMYIMLSVAQSFV